MTTSTRRKRTQSLDILASWAEGVGAGDDFGDMLGALRLVEIAAGNARSAIIADARANGETWQSIADALGISRQAAQQRYGA